MAVYDQSGVLKEMPIYGSQRIGMVKALDIEGQFTHGNRLYEYSNHLGNVLAVSTDKMTAVGEHGDLISASNYYPFGLRIGDRSMNSGDYRYGFNGKEDDRDFSKSQLIQNYGFRLYNPALGKFLSVDPLTKRYPWYTPYQFAGNKPIWAVDLDGLEELISNDNFSFYKNELKLTTESSDHLMAIMNKISDPTKAENIKIYFAADTYTGGNENAYATQNLAKQAASLIKYENALNKKLNENPMVLSKILGNEKSRKNYKKYIKLSSAFQAMGLSFDKLAQDYENNPQLEVYAVIMNKHKLNGQSTASAMKSLFHEVELHIQRHLGVRKNPDGLQQNGVGDHDYGHSFSENEEYYNKHGYTREKLEDGFSPHKGIIIETSPTGKTNKEVDKYYDNVGDE